MFVWCFWWWLVWNALLIKFSLKWMQICVWEMMYRLHLIRFLKQSCLKTKMSRESMAVMTNQLEETWTSLQGHDLLIRTCHTWIYTGSICYLDGPQPSFCGVGCVILSQFKESVRQAADNRGGHERLWIEGRETFYLSKQSKTVMKWNRKYPG